MSKRIAIVDYSLGNLFSVIQAITQCGAEPLITNNPEMVRSADAIVLPGVGAFGEAMNNLRQHKLDIAIKDSIDTGKQFLGICLGMQLLFDSSEEFGATQGLGIIQGEINKFPTSYDHKKLHVPQVAWNTISPDSVSWNKTMLEGIEKDEYVYFVHSYFAVPKFRENILAVTNYGGIEYCSAVIKNNVTAAQFHPEKSGTKGLLIYKNWLNKV